MNFAKEMKIYMKHFCTAAGKKKLVYCYFSVGIDGVCM